MWPQKNARPKGRAAFALDARPPPRHAFVVNRPPTARRRSRPNPALPLCVALALVATARAQTVPTIAPVESLTHIAPGATIPLPFVIENPNERRANCSIFFNFRDKPVWEGSAKLDPGERLQYTAQIDSKHFLLDSRPVRARIAATVEMADERQSQPMEIVFAPLLPLQPQCRFRIRGQHRIDGPPHRSDLLAEVSLHAEGSALRCRLLYGAAPPDASWELLYQPIIPTGPVPEATHLVVRRATTGGPTIEVASGPPPDARLESPPEAGDGRVLDIIFPAGSEQSVSLQVVLWLREGDATEGYCPFASNLDQARDPAYAPELIPLAKGPTHRAWVRAASP